MCITSVGHHTSKLRLSALFVGSILGVGGLSFTQHVQARGVNAPSAPDFPVTPLVYIDAGLPVVGEPWDGDPTVKNIWDYELKKFFQLVCVILMCTDDSAALGTAASSEKSATQMTQELIDSYRTQGLLPNLTEPEINAGILAAQGILNHVRSGRGTPGTLGMPLAVELDQTMEDILDELNSLRGTAAGGH